MTGMVPPGVLACPHARVSAAGAPLSAARAQPLPIELPAPDCYIGSGSPFGRIHAPPLDFAPRQRIAGAVMVDLSGTLSADGRTLAGRIAYESCEGFRVSRAA